MFILNKSSEISTIISVEARVVNAVFNFCFLHIEYVM